MVSAAFRRLTRLAVLMMNKSPVRQGPRDEIIMKTDLAMLGLRAGQGLQYSALDLWDGSTTRLLGDQGVIARTVPAHGSVLLKVFQTSK